MTRSAFVVLGWMAVGLGVVGIVLPGLPTTPFLILAAFLFGKGSPRARVWLVEHAHFGPLLRNWEREGAISRRTKFLSAATMAAMLGGSALAGLAGWILLLQALCMIPAAAFILTRPDPRGG